MGDGPKGPELTLGCYFEPMGDSEQSTVLCTEDEICQTVWKNVANLAMLDKTTPFAFSSESNSLYFQHNWPLATVGDMGGYFWKRQKTRKD